MNVVMVVLVLVLMFVVVIAVVLVLAEALCRRHAILPGSQFSSMG